MLSMTAKCFLNKKFPEFMTHGIKIFFLEATQFSFFVKSKQENRVVFRKLIINDSSF